MTFFKRKIQFNDDLTIGSSPVVKNRRVLNTDVIAYTERKGLN